MLGFIQSCLSPNHKSHGITAFIMGGAWTQKITALPLIVCDKTQQITFPVNLNVYLFLRETERERQSVSGGGAEQEGDTESKAGSRLRTVSTEPNAGLEPMNCEIMT